MNKLDFKILEKNINLVKKYITFGVEIEGNYNLDKVDFDDDDVYDYHSEEDYHKYDFFKIERDGSLDDDYFNNNINCEVISKPIAYKDFDDLFYKFKSLLNITDYMGGAVHFDSSTGAHIHISLNNTKFIQKLTNFNIAKEIETEIYNFLDRNLFLFKDIKSNFFRGYAKRLTKNNIQERYVSINTHTNKPTIEIRSVNLYGVVSLSQMYILYKEILNIVSLIIAKHLTKNTLKNATNLYIKQVIYNKEKATNNIIIESE